MLNLKMFVFPVTYILLTDPYKNVHFRNDNFFWRVQHILDGERSLNSYHGELSWLSSFLAGKLLTFSKYYSNFISFQVLSYTFSFSLLWNL